MLRRTVFYYLVMIFFLNNWFFNDSKCHKIAGTNAIFHYLTVPITDLMLKNYNQNYEYFHPPIYEYSFGFIKST